ncbi:hypothetical protein ACFLYB_07380 [Chloroflexota bacterium]
MRIDATQEYILAVNTSGYGEVTVTGAYEAGASVSIVATPRSDEWIFYGWVGDISTVDNPDAAQTDFTVNKIVLLPQNFKPKEPPPSSIMIAAIIGGIAFVSITVL